MGGIEGARDGGEGWAGDVGGMALEVANQVTTTMMGLSPPSWSAGKGIGKED